MSSPRYSLELELPDRENWFVDDQTTPWFVARHAATRSEIVARIWRAPRLVRREECETQARLWRPAIPKTADESVMERRVITTPAGFSGELVVGVAPLSASSELQGFAVVFGSSVGRCYALVYTTTAAGRGADAALGRRLAIVADEIVPRVRLRGIDERVH